MAPKMLVAGWSLAALLAAPLASAEPAIKVAPASSPPTVDARARVALHDVVEQDLASDDALRLLDAYTVFPNLIELRRFVDAADSAQKLVCVVELVAVNGAGDIVARTRSTANSETATQKETLTVAAHAATARLTVSLDAISRAESKRKAVARR
jgi:hypothetical protein